MANSYASNPFQALQVDVPLHLHAQIERYSQTGGSGKTKNMDLQPFPRMIDMWFLAVCVAAHLDLKPKEIGKNDKPKTIVLGSIFGSDPWRINTLMLIAIAKSGDVNIVAEPTRMMRIAIGLAIAGIPKVVEMLEGKSDPIWDLSDAIDEMLED